MQFDRRRFLLSAAVSAAAHGLPDRAVAAEPEKAAPESSVALEAHAIDGGGTDGGPPALTYGSAASRPVLRMPKGALFRVTLTNRLGEPTGVDWHGMRVSNTPDMAPGLTGTPLAPGATGDFALKPADAGTSWFHPPFVPGWSDQTGRGLAGVVIVEETDAPAVDDDRVLVLTDRLGAGGHGLQDRLAVNGKAWPETATHAPGARLRLRIVNGSTRQALAATFAGAQPLVVAIDGQPSELFRPLNDTLPVGPGARFDILVDLPRTAGAQFALLLRGADQAPPSAGSTAFAVRTEGVPRPERPPVAALSPNPALPRVIPLERATRVDLTVQKSSSVKAAQPGPFSINGVDGRVLPKKPLFAVKRNTAVTLGFANKTTDLVALRPHGHVMRQLHPMDDGWEPYWRDSILVPPGKTFHAAFLADNPGRWLIESPFFDQTTSGLRSWFEVT